ncbi:MAG: NAD kinase [Planctomycetota bacterium]
MSASGLSTLAIDGQSYHRLTEGSSIMIRRHPEPYPLFVMPGLDPFRRLRSRLGWGNGLEEKPTT